MPKFTQEPKSQADTQEEEAIKKHVNLLQESLELKKEVNFEALSVEMPYTFISLQAMYETLCYYKYNATKPIRFGFKCFENVYDFYKKMLDFKKDASTYFKKAESIVKVQHVVGELNLNITKSKTLDHSLCMFNNESLFRLANNALSLLPEYSQLITPEFKSVVLNSALHELPIEELKKLVDTNIIRESNFYSFKCESLDATEKLEELKKYLESRGAVFQTEKTFQLKLKGVTFAGKNNENRQKAIEEMNESFKKGETISLSLEHYEFTPDLGVPEPACRVLWNGKDIGNLPKDTTKALLNKYKGKKTLVSLEKIVGGAEDINYGVDINLSVQLLERTPEGKEVIKQ